MQERTQRNRYGVYSYAVCVPCQQAKRRETQGRGGGKTPPPRPPSLTERLSAPTLPWATPDVCAAVRRGIESAVAQKTGRFALVRNDNAARDILVHVPTERLSFPRDRIVLVATRTPSRRWKQLPAAATRNTETRP